MPDLRRDLERSEIQDATNKGNSEEVRVVLDLLKTVCHLQAGPHWKESAKLVVENAAFEVGFSMYLSESESEVRQLQACLECETKHFSDE